MFHIQLRQFPNVSREFNLAEDELRARILGPWLAKLTTNDITEWPAVWCLLSIGLLTIAVKTPIRRVLYVRQWWLWPRSWRSNAASARGDAGMPARQAARLGPLQRMPPGTG